ncbi:H/ACA ribonucleoprotein complex non-core subunit NAF1 [Phymastichus coffea]|uniref:H/ACA ribonucleoprotein complex non-core subunit NAF1 n=1 Tax=Phymastichus coffea TaxID=108790 RepID=UPI00273B7E82|nr:H/ACA ribonucleoprotein complex non-core subunit NAF1 [Phymastichus coffea]
MDEHDYANVRKGNPEASNTLLYVNSIPSNMMSSLGQSSLNNVMYSDNNSVLKEELILSEEIIIESNEYNAYVNKQNIKNTNLSNELASHNMTRGMFYIDKQTSLAAIAAQYDSSGSENEDDQNADLINNKDYRNKEIILSSAESSDSESDSSSSDSNDSDAKSSEKSKKNASDNDESDDATQSKNVKNKQKKFTKPKSEFDDLPPIEDLTISVPEVLCDPLGEIAWTVEQMVVVRPKPGKPTLNLDTVLFIDKGQRALGRIFDVFGQVAEPHYCVRFNSSVQIQEKDIKVGMTVYYCPNTQYTSLVFLSELTKMKAADDIGEDEAPQFSDDEEEQAYLASLKNKQSESTNKSKEGSSETPVKRKRGNNTGWQSNHPWNTNREHQSYPHAQNPRPFYRTHHLWSRLRYQQPNPWHQYNSYPSNQWMLPPQPSYHHMQPYNYLNPAQMPPVEMQNVGFSQVQWNPQYQLPQVNAAEFSGFPPTLIPPINLPPPPPPPPPSANMDT